MAPLDGPQPSAGPRMVTTVLLLACCRFWTLAAAGAVTVPACDVPVSLATLGGLSTAQQWNEQGPQIFPFQPGCVLHRHVPKTSLLRRRLSAGAAPAQGSLAVLTFVSDPAYLWVSEKGRGSLQTQRILGVRGSITQPMLSCARSASQLFGRPVCSTAQPSGTRASWGCTRRTAWGPCPTQTTQPTFGRSRQSMTR